MCAICFCHSQIWFCTFFFWFYKESVVTKKSGYSGCHEAIDSCFFERLCCLESEQECPIIQTLFKQKQIYLPGSLPLRVGEAWKRASRSRPVSRFDSKTSFSFLSSVTPDLQLNLRRLSVAVGFQTPPLDPVFIQQLWTSPALSWELFQRSCSFVLALVRHELQSIKVIIMIIWIFHNSSAGLAKFAVISVIFLPLGLWLIALCVRRLLLHFYLVPFFPEAQTK